MSIKNLVTVVCVVASFSCFANTVDAQRSPWKVNQGFRWLGSFQSTGYHWRTPGPCVGYYNPYSQHNSELRIGGVPQGAGQYMAYGIGGGCSDCVGGFDQPASFSNQGTLMGPAIPTPNSNTVDSEIDDGEYEEDQESPSDEEIEADAKSILDEIEAIDEKKVGPEEAERVDGASLWSDVFELSKIDQRSMDRRAIERRAAYAARIRQRK